MKCTPHMWHMMWISLTTTQPGGRQPGCNMVVGGSRAVFLVDVPCSKGVSAEMIVWHPPGGHPVLA
jgi:hypothetical protein